MFRRGSKESKDAPAKPKRRALRFRFGRSRPDRDDAISEVKFSSPNEQPGQGSSLQVGKPTADSKQAKEAPQQMPAEGETEDEGTTKECAPLRRLGPLLMAEADEESLVIDSVSISTRTISEVEDALEIVDKHAKKLGLSRKQMLKCLEEESAAALSQDDESSRHSLGSALKDLDHALSVHESANDQSRTVGRQSNPPSTVDDKTVMSVHTLVQKLERTLRDDGVSVSSMTVIEVKEFLRTLDDHAEYFGIPREEMIRRLDEDQENLEKAATAVGGERGSNEKDDVISGGKLETINESEEETFGCFVGSCRTEDESVVSMAEESRGYASGQSTEMSSTSETRILDHCSRNGDKESSIKSNEPYTISGSKSRGTESLTNDPACCDWCLCVLDCCENGSDDNETLKWFLEEREARENYSLVHHLAKQEQENIGTSAHRQKQNDDYSDTQRNSTKKSSVLQKNKVGKEHKIMKITEKSKERDRRKSVKFGQKNKESMPEMLGGLIELSGSDDVHCFTNDDNVSAITDPSTWALSSKGRTQGRSEQNSLGRRSAFPQIQLQNQKVRQNIPLGKLLDKRSPDSERGKDDGSRLEI